MQLLKTEWLEDIKTIEYLIESTKHYRRINYTNKTVKWECLSISGEYFYPYNISQTDLETLYQKYIMPPIKQGEQQ